MTFAEPSVPSTPSLLSRHGPVRLRRLTDALRGEWIKLSTVRATKAIVILTVLGGLAMSWAVAEFVTDKVLTVTEVGFFWTTPVSVLAALSGVLMFTAEVQHGTLAGALTAQPTRWITALAKIIASAALGLTLGMLGIASGFAGAATSGLGAGDTSLIPATTAWALVFTTLSAVLGLGVGLIVRSSAGTISGLLVWWFVIEPLLNAFLPAKLARLLPFVAGNHLIAYKSDINAAKSIPVQLSRPENLLIFGTYVAIALAIGIVLLNRRDAG